MKIFSSPSFSGKEFSAVLKLENGEVKYKLLGEGDLPIASMLLALESVNYDGFLSYECQPETMEDFGIADIVYIFS